MKFRLKGILLKFGKESWIFFTDVNGVVEWRKLSHLISSPLHVLFDFTQYLYNYIQTEMVHRLPLPPLFADETDPDWVMVSTIGGK